ncbi:unnamed protein product [Vitrella brassicaformis CCMP3155]|uniref:Uncharacterized protein n=1 Tax=Vitrella brassicaformis (strain CCMP3155) TaxID=1169540 RepID=A0A0G4FBN2_VITBC|nr:unnamed protein product [Vitrella brassicaformis CCMP3155]|eukprot:CEM10285.1 unnamed protein product [Vitrella brassicaformis CCMP3155]
MIDRYADNGRLDTILTQSPHRPVEGYTTTTSYRFGGIASRRLVLTDASHSFVAWITVEESLNPNTNNVRVSVSTTESAVPDQGGAFKDRFPVTYRLARVMLGPVISAMIFGQ